MNKSDISKHYRNHNRMFENMHEIDNHKSNPMELPNVKFDHIIGYEIYIDRATCESLSCPYFEPDDIVWILPVDHLTSIKPIHLWDEQHRRILYEIEQRTLKLVGMRNAGTWRILDVR